MKYFIHLPMKMEPIVSSETSAIRTQTPGNYPKRNKLHLKYKLLLCCSFVKCFVLVVNCVVLRIFCVNVYRTAATGCQPNCS